MTKKGLPTVTTFSESGSDLCETRLPPLFVGFSLLYGNI
jgi:hypothetical protein